jgi:two-component system cell cycle sensor histidine kinase/response regulator CckA
MSLLLVVSIVIRIAAIVWAMAWSLVLLRRLRDWRMAFLTALLGLMTLRESLTLLGRRELGLISVISGAAEQPGIVLSIALFIAIPFLARMLTERKRAEDALRQSEATFRVLAETAKSAILIAQGPKLVYINPFAEALVGYSKEELLSMDASGLVHPDFRELVRARGQARLRGDRSPSRYELKILTKSGDEVWLDFAASPMEFEGKPALLGTAFDITERKRAEDALRASEERYRDLVENARDIIYSHDLKGNYTSVNKAAEQLTGYTREESLKLNFEQTVAPEYVETARQMIAAKFAGQKETVYDLEIIAKDGRRITVEVNTRLVLHNDVPIGIQGIARDVTERKRAEEALRHSEERFRRYFELGLFGMVITSPAKGFIEVNDKICEILGYERTELLQVTWAELTHPDDLAADIAISSECWPRSPTATRWTSDSSERTAV